MKSDAPDFLRRRAALQAGIITRQQALKEGMTRDSIRSKVKCGRWQRVYPGVYALPPGGVDRQAQFWAALLWAGDDAVLSHESAAEIHRMLDKPAADIHLTVPRDRHLSALPGIRVHRCDRVLGLRDRYPRGLVPTTWPADTVLDLTQTAGSPDEICDWIARAFRTRAVSEGMLLAALGRRPQLKHRADIMTLIREAASGTHSVLEYRYDRDVERAHGLPRSHRQVPNAMENGTRGYRDRCYEPFRVIVELDGRVYHRDEWADTRRDNEAAASYASQTLRFGWRSVRWHPCETAVTVARVLIHRGWPGHLSPCGPACMAGGDG
jgi:hypothetical protein